ncbi:MAG: lysine transporter LysE, partial [Anaerolineae bacterium]|nr:lysine transporter LysE [Anaerolineae bacterium]
LVTGPILLSAWRESPLRAAGFLIGFYGTMVICLAVVIVLFSTARRLGVRVARAMLGISAATLTCFGIYQILQGIS